MAAGFLAGALGGLVFLIAGFARDGSDFVVYWPAPVFALCLIVRSVAVYTLLFGTAGLVLAGVLRPILRHRGYAVFALVLGAVAAVTVLAYLTAWWQIEVLAGLPIGNPERLRGALSHGLAALVAGAVVSGLELWRIRRGQAGCRRVSLTRPVPPAIATATAAVLLLALGEAGIKLSGSGEDTMRLSPSGGTSNAGGRPTQVVVVGLDGMTLRVLSPLLRAGELPAFRRLMAEGAWGTLLTYGTASSPQIWTSMATGKRVRDHGIDDFVKAHGSGPPGGGQESRGPGGGQESRGPGRVPEVRGPAGGGPARSYRAAVMKSSDRKTRAVWNVLSDAGRRVAVVDWLVTFPPEEVNGYVVSRLKLDVPGSTHPPELDAELAELWGERPEGSAGSPPSGATRQQLLWNVDRVFAAAGHLLAKERLDFLAVYDATVDRVEHLSWKYYQAERFAPELWQIDPARGPELSALIPDVYRHLDRRLGELLERLADDALVLVVSDHGQRAAKTPRVSLRLDRLLAALGYCRLLEDSGSRDRVDYRRSSAYTLVETPWKPVLRVNLNLRGREARGTVEAREAAAVAGRLAADLRAVRFEDGTPLFAAVDQTREPAANRARGADLRVTLSRWARSLERSSERLAIGDEPLPLSHYQRVNPKISGAHDHQGVVFARGPGIKPGFIGQRLVPTAINDLLWHLTDKVDAVDRLLPLLRSLGLVGRASTIDLTPTVLYALGLPVARDMFGRPLKALFEDPPEVEWLASYEPTHGERRLAEEEDPSDEEYLKRLRALGYVD